MEINTLKLTGEKELMWAVQCTSNYLVKDFDLDMAYGSMHSPIRSQLFQITLIGIPTFVSIHLVRHSIGVTHYVKTNRDDRGGDLVADRNTPVTHGMIINAEALINMARKRLCRKAHKKTQDVMYSIRLSLRHCDPLLYSYLVPECVFRGGACHEMKPCGYLEHNMEIY